ncbi:MAG: hypothetical protein UY76_C0007G0009 [Candidatus Uhrbacteria bacterium GW2011_GWA2_52_8d]|uniref:Uncharacterized protein n=1 Tax=Candidatus Uhrbacteria bacterium GW2011_GWA2_52_8d TaxID=1618979 RepID=A0A0G1XPQ7_9BACT|nr:MAG: hypothetical protein UY76_C0007G0009 [Candidatus Uhrbacteria bacterium GW2011_GWA2_52_8d]
MSKKTRPTCVDRARLLGVVLLSGNESPNSPPPLERPGLLPLGVASSSTLLPLGDDLTRERQGRISADIAFDLSGLNGVQTDAMLALEHALDRTRPDSVPV